MSRQYPVYFSWWPDPCSGHRDLSSGFGPNRRAYANPVWTKP